MKTPDQLSPLQLQVLRVLWRTGEARVAEVHAELSRERRLAPTTVATVLARLKKQGVVKARTEARQLVYRAALEEAEAERAMVGELTERLFAGDVSKLVGHLLDAQDLGAGDLAKLKALIEAREREEETR